MPVSGIGHGAGLSGMDSQSTPQKPEDFAETKGVTFQDGREGDVTINQSYPTFTVIGTYMKLILRKQRIRAALIHFRAVLKT